MKLLKKTHRRILFSLIFIFLSSQILYSQLVQQEWVATYTNPNGLGAGPRDMVIDTLGNVYETGGILTSGVQSNNFATIKYNNSGIQQWVKIYNGPGTNSIDVGVAIAIDKWGNVIVTGNSEQYGFLTDAYCTVKYDSAGNQLWVARYKNLPDRIDDPSAIVVDDSGNVYVTGSSQSPRGYPGPYIGYDYLTIKYNPNGDSLWVRRYRGPGTGNPDNFANSICLDNQDNVYVTGISPGYYASEVCTIKYNRNGVQQWVFRNDTARTSDGLKVTTDKTTNDVYVCGYSGGGSYPQYFMVTKINSIGTQQWVNYYTGSTSGSGYNIAVDNLHNIYATGIIYIPQYGDSYLTIKYNSNGDTLWTSKFIRVNGDNNPPKIALDKYNSVYITGDRLNGSYNEFATIKYSSNGLQQWLMTHPGGGAKITVNKNLDVFVAGASVTGTDFITIKYSQPDGIISFNKNVPSKFILFQNYPDPFNPTTKINFELPKESFTKLIIYDLLGREVATLVNEQLKPGTYEVEWNGSSYASGVYFYNLTSADFTETKKMVLMK